VATTDSALTPQLLRAAVDGKANAWPVLFAASHDELLTTAEGLALTVTVASVRRVLSAMQSGAISPADAQAWASFVRRGYVEGRTEPVRPIEVDYDVVAEAQIVEVVAWLDEIGDVVDGTPPDAAEVDALMASLGEPD
jgi:hypothetical protein